MFTGIIAMDPAGPIFETNSIGNIYTYIQISESDKKSNYSRQINIEVTFLFFQHQKDFRLDRCDAGWVEVVHTHTMQHGYAVMHISFYINAISHINVYILLIIIKRIKTMTIMIYFQTPLGDVDFYANGGEVQPNCHPIYDPQCSIGSAYKLLTHHYNVSINTFSKLIIKI